VAFLPFTASDGALLGVVGRILPVGAATVSEPVNQPERLVALRERVVEREAAVLQQAWRIEVPEALHTEEYRAYRSWRQSVREACRAGGWRTADEVLAWRIECIERGIGGLPARLGIAGFIAPDPVVSHLLAVLEARGVELFQLDFGRGQAARRGGHAICWQADRRSGCALPSRILRRKGDCWNPHSKRPCIQVR
jgi:hypothetical protein